MQMEGNNACQPAVRRYVQGDRWAVRKETARQRRAPSRSAWTHHTCTESDVTDAHV